MNILDRITNTTLKFLATGRIARKGLLFRVNPHSRENLILRQNPGQRASDFQYFFRIKPGDKASLLVLKVQEEQPLWDQWVKVLFCRLNGPNNDDTMIGWIPYHEFNRLVLAQWEQWEDEETQSRE